jgi:hypothetical protein
MRCFDKRRCRGLMLMACLLGMPPAASTALAASDAPADYGVQRSDESPTFECRRHHHYACTYWVVTVYNTHRYPVWYQIRYTRYGRYHSYCVPAHGWCCHWTTCSDAAFRIHVEGQTYRAAANRVRLSHPPCACHGASFRIGP